MSAYSTGLPSEMRAENLNASLPEGSYAKNVRIQPTNLQTVVSPITTLPATAAVMPDAPQNVQTLNFDVPSGNYGDWIDVRQSSIQFRAVYAVQSAGTSNVVASANLRSSGASFFDKMEVMGPNGTAIESIGEYGVIMDTLVNFQQSNSVRDGVGVMMGYESGTAITSVGHAIPALTGTIASGSTQSNSYCLPLLSGVLGFTSEKFFPIGAVPKLQCQLTTSAVLPLTIYGTSGTAGTFTVTLTDFVLNLVYINIPAQAQKMLESSLHEGKYFLGSTTWRATSANLPAGSAGFNSVLTGLRGSSVKSIFARFAQSGSAAANWNGKYNSYNPNLQTIAFNFSGVRYPPIPTEVLVNPARAFCETSRAFGNFNSTELVCSVPAANYAALSAGSTAQGLSNTAQDYLWNVPSGAVAQNLFVYGTSLATCNKYGILNGLNINSATGYLELQIAGSGPTYQHTAYVIGALDQIIIVDAATGQCDVRI